MATQTEIPLPEGRSLRVVQQAAGDKPADLVQALGLTADAVVVLAGGADEPDAALRPKLQQLLNRGLLRGVRDARALVVARAGAGGIAGLYGSAVADAEGALPLLGVGPSARLTRPGDTAPGDGKEPTAPGLSHLLLTAGADWGSELRTKIDVAQALAGSNPALLVVIGGGDEVPAEVLQAVRRRWTVLLVQGTGGAAHALAAQWAARKADGDDPTVAEILADGKIDSISLGDDVGVAVQTLVRQVLRDAGGDSVLRQAWRRFAAIDAAAIRQQRDFTRVQTSVLLLGVAAVLLAVFQSLLTLPPLELQSFAGMHLPESIRAVLRQVLAAALIVVPIGTSVLIAASNRLKPGKRFVLLRSAAEAIKREIYRYRLSAAGYAEAGQRDKNLAEAVENITRRLARTEANTVALPAFTGPIPPKNTASPGDDGLSFLTTDRYVRFRLDDQLQFYRRKTVKLEREFSRLQIAVLVAGAAGTLLAALGGEWVIWIAFSSAVAGALMTQLSYRQVETTLTGYNQTATDLENILAWWTALDAAEQAQPGNIENLSAHTEQVLANELAGWTQRMTDALEKLRETQEPKTKDDAAAADGAGSGAGGAAAAKSADAGDATPAAQTGSAGAADPGKAAADIAGKLTDATILALQSDNGEVAHNAAGTQDEQEEVARGNAADAAANADAAAAADPAPQDDSAAPTATAAAATAAASDDKPADKPT